MQEGKCVLVAILQLLRPKQWIKNVFVLAPLIFSGHFLNAHAILESIFAAVLFNIASSSTYIINDIQDIQLDKQHPIKSTLRPLARGDLKISHAVRLLIILYGLLIWSYFYLPAVVTIIGIYLLLNLAYTFFLKHQPVIDIFIIAIGFVLRVYAGAIAISVPLSSWMLITTLCLALYLAAIKRKQELSFHEKSSRPVLAHYTIALVERYAEMSAGGALLFYSMFVMLNNAEMVFTIPLVIYGLFRYWFLVDSLEGGESPTDTLFKDWQLILTIILWIIVSIWAISVKN